MGGFAVGSDDVFVVFHPVWKLAPRNELLIVREVFPVVVHDETQLVVRRFLSHILNLILGLGEVGQATVLSYFS